MASYRPDLERRRLVEALAACGVSDTDVARVFGIDIDTLRCHHQAELETGLVLANAQVAESLFRKALGDGPQSVAAAMFWLKTRAGWSEATAPQKPLEITGVKVTFHIPKDGEEEPDIPIRVLHGS